MRSDPRGLTVSDSGLPAARREIERWRRSAGRGRSIPLDLWERARELARAHGVSRTARELGLDYYSLARRMQATESGGGEDRRGAEASAFVELNIPMVATGQARAAMCRLELSDGGGTRLCIEFDGAEPAAIAVLARELWGAGR